MSDHKTLYLLPWEPIWNGERTEVIGYERCDFRIKSAMAYIYIDINTKIWYSWLNGRSSGSLQTLISEYDAYLIEKGYVLIPEDQVERYREKLMLLL